MRRMARVHAPAHSTHGTGDFTDKLVESGRALDGSALRKGDGFNIGKVLGMSIVGRPPSHLLQFTLPVLNNEGEGVYLMS